MTIRDHLSAHHTKAAEFHKAVAAEHSGLAASHHALAKAHGGAVGEHHKTMAAHHEKLSSLHKGYAEHHAGQAEACMKAADGDLNKLMPTGGVSGATPDNPNFRAIPRAGQREPAKLNVPVEFQKMFSVEDEEEARIG